MRLCHNCGAPIDPGMETHPVCGMYHCDDWHLSNRIWCAYFHRGIPIERVDTFVDEPVVIEWSD